MKSIQHDTAAPPVFALLSASLLLLAALLPVGGCAHGPIVVQKSPTIDPAVVEYPPGFDLRLFATGLTAPTGFSIDAENNSLIVVESGIDGREPRVLAFHLATHKITKIYPADTRIPLSPFQPGFRIYGPANAVVASKGAFVAHRDNEGHGVITRFGYDGSHVTVVADLPAQGDYGINDLALSPDDRLYFCVVPATNSSVVGLDNMRWVRKHRNFHDTPAVPLKLRGFRFTTYNPFADIFQGYDLATTSPDQPFGHSLDQRIPAAANGKPSSAVYSVNPNGGDLKVVAHGIRNPRGIGRDEFFFYFTNDGFEMRGTRPLVGVSDAMLKLVEGAWYGFPDYTPDLIYLDSPEAHMFQPPTALIEPFGYKEISALIDLVGSGLDSKRPDPRELLITPFSPQSGAAKLDFIPQTSGAFARYRGDAIVAMDGDRAPWAVMAGWSIKPGIGYKLVRVDVMNKQTEDFIRNTTGLPASKSSRRPEAMERPIDVKFNAADGTLYVLDFGQMELKSNRIKIIPGTGKIYRLSPVASPATKP